MKKGPQHHSVWTGNILPTSTAANGLPAQEDIVDDDSRGVRSAAEIETLLTEREVSTDRDQRIILYCNTSRRLSHTFVVLRSLGFTDVAIYEGSMTDWTAAGGATESIV